MQSGTTNQGFQPKRWRATTENSTLVITMVVDTASPYAAARLVDERNPTTRAMQATIRNQLIDEM